MSLLTVVQNAADEIGITRPSTVIGNSNQTVRQMLALLNREGKNLAKMRNAMGGGWTVLERTHTFSTSDGEDEYALPSDYGELLGDTVWDRSNYWQVRGPLSPADWQALRSGLVNNAALRKKFRIRRVADFSDETRKFSIEPEPSATETVAFEYLSNAWVADSAGTTFYTDFSNADDDQGLLPEDLLEMGLIWRFKKAKSFDYTADLAEYEIERDKRFAQDAGPSSVSIGQRRFRLPQAIVPETGFGS